MAFFLLRTTVATLLAFGGGALGIALAGSERHLKTLVYAAMGALLAVTVFDILPDAKTLLSWPIFLAGTASGAVLFWLVGRYVSQVCPACAVGNLDRLTAERLARNAILLMAALSLHSAMDGIAVVVGDTIVGHANIGVLFAVSLHKIPEGLALSLLLRGAGYPPRAALLWTFGIESTTELGGLIGVLFLRHLSLPTLGLIFAHVGGGFLYLIASTLGIVSLPSLRFSRERFSRPLLFSAGMTFAVTALLIWGLRVWVP